MSVAFTPHRQRGKGDITPAGIQKLLDENNQLIQCIMDFQSKGKTAECSQYQQMLHRNLVYLATIADSNQNMQSLLPAPPTQNMPMGPGGMNQSGPPTQPPHGHNMPSDGMVSGGPPAPHMQNQMNGQMPGPMMHQQPPSQQYNMPPGGAGPHYQGQQNPMGMMGQVNQGNHVMGQRPMPPYRPPQQGPPQQYPGQEDYYGDQYSHAGQGASEGNAQYGQQQEPYQQGPPQQQGYPPQQQYPGQQGYPPQQQAYGPSQSGPGQYPNYPQGQGQQYAAYRPPQPGPPQGQQQRPYGYDQVSIATRAHGRHGSPPHLS
ncbi:protein SSXT isoform X8 [Takifugu flavidus]|uniref:protein SSXT isoform X8 n=1 Tax=Takifugu flavidus TaxID=433684 RepID=UPI002543FD2F|nr:protein SSXT isoform X8 [Takifugu flavidus]